MHAPSATYRLQFNSGFRFEDAERIIPYLARLGINCIYASPIFKARPRSPHGYDVTDPNQINPEIGTPEQFDRLIETSHQHGIEWIQDFVPNHMAYDSNNNLLMDIFEKGRSSRFFPFFDIVWDHLRENLRGKVIAPFLGKPYGETLASGELKIQYEDGRFRVRYYDTVYPISIKSYAKIIGHNLGRLKQRLGEDHGGYIKVLAIVSLLQNIPDDINEHEAEPVSAQLSLAQDTLRQLYKDDLAIREHIRESVAALNDDENLLHETLSEQWFQLTYWRVATKEINYQRFFNVNELISLSMENSQVFDFIHQLVLRLLSEGKINGLRIDHVDGLYNPTAYLMRLRRASADAYIVVEKILESNEELPAIWPVDGTTGYEFTNHVNGLFVDWRNKERFDQIYSHFGGDSLDYEDLLYERKKLIIERHLTGDLDNLTSLLKSISTTTRDAIDLEWEALNTAIVETSAVFPVYRTYLTDSRVNDRDRVYIKQAIEKARLRNNGQARALDFLESVLLLNFPDYLEEADKPAWQTFVMRFQQFTSPLMAKGLEDTTFYIYNRLISLNEVGGDPSRFGLEARDFHSFNLNRLALAPHTMNTTATHDTKRGEDVRARINVLSEIPDEWEKSVKQWHKQNQKFKKVVNDEEVPDKNREYFIYQTIVGAYPLDERASAGFLNRLKEYVIKAEREAKTHTFWLDNNVEYEEAVLSFIDALFDPSDGNEFLKSIVLFQRKVSHYGMLNSLSQALIKITSPGLPDFYQGSELWDFNLVDPDNRRPVDYEKREQALRDIVAKREQAAANLLGKLFENLEDGGIKLFTIMRALEARNELKEMFEGGSYIPLNIAGKYANNLICFARRKDRRWAITIAPRFCTSLVEAGKLPIGRNVWQNTAIELPDDAPLEWENIFSDETVEGSKKLLAGDALNKFPVALLISK